jgi:tetratricopeptide (TPR) repeat protein
VVRWASGLAKNGPLSLVSSQLPRRIRLRRILLLLWLLPVSLWAQTSLPSPVEVKFDPEAAKKHFYNAKIFFELGQFEAAIREYQEAYLCEQRAEFLYNLAQVYRRQGEVKGSLESMRMALFHFDLFLKKEPKSPYKRDVEGLMKDLERDIKRTEEKLAEADERRRFRLRDDKDDKKEPDEAPQTMPVKATDETLQIILGRDYTAFIDSGLTLDGYFQIKRGKRNVRFGATLAGTGLLVGTAGAILRFNDAFEDVTAVRVLGASGALVGGISFVSGAFLLPYGVWQQKSGKLDKRAKPESKPAN